MILDMHVEIVHKFQQTIIDNLSIFFLFFDKLDNIISEVFTKEFQSFLSSFFRSSSLFNESVNISNLGVDFITKLIKRLGCSLLLLLQNFRDKDLGLNNAFLFLLQIIDNLLILFLDFLFNFPKLIQSFLLNPPSIFPNFPLNFLTILISFPGNTINSFPLAFSHLITGDFELLENLRNPIQLIINSLY